MAKKTMFLEEYTIKGSHSEKANALTEKVDYLSEAKIFNSVVELFCFAALFGCYKDRRSKPEKDSSRTKKIFADAFRSHIEDLKLAFKFVILTSDKACVSSVERLNKTFRNSETDENFSLFEEYALGGIDELYDSLMVDSNTRYENYLTALNKILSEISVPKDEPEIGETSTEKFFKSESE